MSKDTGHRVICSWCTAL